MQKTSKETKPLFKRETIWPNQHKLKNNNKQLANQEKTEVRETLFHQDWREEGKKNMGLLTADLFQAVRAMIKRMLNLDAQISGRFVPSTPPGFNLSNTD